MMRAFRYLGTWLWFALIGWLILLVLVWAPFAWLVTEVLGRESLAPEALGAGLAAVWFVTAGAGTLVSRRRERKGRALAPLETLTSGLRVVVLLAILALVMRGVLQVVPGGAELALAGHLRALFAPAESGLVAVALLLRIPAELAGGAAAPVALFLLLVFSGNALRWRLDRLRGSGWAHRFERSGDEAHGGHAPDEATLARARAAERKVALSSYAEARSVLKQSEVELTFLSLDVVGSTTMKQGEDPYVVEQSFSDYRRLVERALRTHGAWKQTWTPDGQMAAFRSPDAAVACAREILEALPRFNQEVSALATPFRVRMGANVGVVSTDEATPMEAISDSAIDVAGHLQKYADPDHLWISAELHGRLEEVEGFRPEERAVDGRAVYSWTPASG